MRNLRLHLADLVALSGRSWQEIDELLKWSTGTVSELLAGRATIGLRHLDELSLVTGASTIELLNRAYKIEDAAALPPPLELDAWLSANEPPGWVGIRTAYRSGAKARLAGKGRSQTRYRLGDRFIKYFLSGFDAMDQALSAGALFACPLCHRALPVPQPFTESSRQLSQLVHG